jgi:Domain of unknown function (DUF3850)
MTPTTHSLKIWPEFFAPVLDGSKKFEIRINDRHFKVGDILNLREYDDRKGTYTGRSVMKRISYILEGGGAGFIAPRAGLHRQYVAMSLEP